MDRGLKLTEDGVARKAAKVDEVVIGISPAFGVQLNYTLSNYSLGEVLFELMAGVEEEGMNARVIRVLKTVDLGFIGSEAAKLSGSGIGIGIQSKGTTIIHQEDLAPLDNLELFSMAPFLNLEIYRKIGKNAALYAKGEQAYPIPAFWGKDAVVVKARTLPKVAIIQYVEEENVIRNSESIELKVEFVSQEVV